MLVLFFTFIFLSCDEGSGEKKRERGHDLPAMDDLTFRILPLIFVLFPFMPSMIRWRSRLQLRSGIQRGGVRWFTSQPGGTDHGIPGR